MLESQKPATGSHQIGFRVDDQEESANKDEGENEQGWNTKSMQNKDIRTKLKKFGMLPEFIGRFPVVVTLDDLDEDALIRILTEPKDSIIKEYTKLFEMDEVELEFTEEALREIARMALATGAGARGLRAMIDDVMKDIMFDLPRPSNRNVRKCLVTKETIMGSGAVLIREAV